MLLGISGLVLSLALFLLWLLFLLMFTVCHWLEGTLYTSLTLKVARLALSFRSSYLSLLRAEVVECGTECPTPSTFIVVFPFSCFAVLLFLMSEFFLFHGWVMRPPEHMDWCLSSTCCCPPTEPAFCRLPQKKLNLSFSEKKRFRIS